MAEPDRLQPRESVAAAGAADEDRHLVAYQLAAAAVKTGGRLIKHARCYWLLLAEGHLTRRLFTGHAAEDRGAAVAGGIRRAQKRSRFR